MMDVVSSTDLLQRELSTFTDQLLKIGQYWYGASTNKWHRLHFSRRYSHSSNGNGFGTPIIVAFSFRSSSTGLSVYPTMSTSKPWRIKDCAWYCILGLRPMSPKTTTQTLFFPIFTGGIVDCYNSRMSTPSVQWTRRIIEVEGFDVPEVRTNPTSFCT